MRRSIPASSRLTSTSSTGSHDGYDGQFDEGKGFICLFVCLFVCLGRELLYQMLNDGTGRDEKGFREELSEMWEEKRMNNCRRNVRKDEEVRREGKLR